MQHRQPKTVTAVIDGTTYIIRQMGARQGREVLFILSSALSGGLTEVSGDFKSLADTGMDDLGKAIQGALNAMGKNNFNLVCDTMAEHTAVQVGNGQLELSMMFDDHFAGRYLEMGKWLVEALKANFSDFFTVFKAKAAVAMAGSPDAQ